MKTKSLLLLATGLLVCISAFGWSPGNDGWRIMEKGPNHQKWSRVTWVTNEVGARVLKTNNIVVMATGMNRLENGSWVECKPHIVPTTNGALCAGAAHQVLLAPNLNTRAAVQLRNSQGNWIQGNVLGLAYTDTTKNKSVLIAQIKDCEGKILDDSHVLYADAFSGLKADVRYTYTKAGFEQDVILREQPPSPEAYGLSGDTVQLVVITEFLDTPKPKVVKFRSPDVVLAERGIKNVKALHSMEGTNWLQSTNVDQLMELGGMKLSFGKAFEMGGSTNSPAMGNAAPVRRHWQEQGKRSFLIEQVTLKDVQDQMKKLPKLSQSGKPKPQGMRNRVMDQLPLPETLLARKESVPMLLAGNMPAAAPGLVLDYDIVGGDDPTNSYSDFVFEPYTTYVIAGHCEMSGTTIFCPGAVIKYDMFTSPDGGDASISTLGPTYFYQYSDRVIFTSTEDNTVGEWTVTTEHPVGVYFNGYSYDNAGGVPAMAMYKNALVIYGYAEIYNIEVRYAGVGISFEGTPDNQNIQWNYIYNSAFVNCGYAMAIDNWNTRVDVENTVFYTGDWTAQWLWPDVSVCDNNWQNYLFDTTPFHVPDGPLGWCCFYGTSLIFDMCQTAGFDTSYHPGFCDNGGCNYNFRSDNDWWYYFDLLDWDSIPDCCQGWWNASPMLPPSPPVITAQPFSATNFVGETVTFSVSTIGSQPLTYQWILNGNAIPGATGSTLTLTTVQVTQAGQYSVVVSNPYGSVASDNVLMVVNTAIPSGIIGWWKGDGNAVDSVAGNNGTMSGASYTNGMVGQAFSFNGNSGSVNIADQPAYALTNSLTMEGWIRPHGIGWTIFFRGDHRPGLDPYFLSMNGGNQIGFYITQANGTGTNINSGTIAYNQWIHVAATLDGSTGLMRLYTNGALAAQITTSYRPFGTLQSNQSPGIGIGNVNDGGNNFPFNGEIDEMALYNRALSQAEIQSIYNAGSSGKCIDSLPPVIISQPVGQTVNAGQSAAFTVAANGTSPISYQWQFNGTNIVGATNATLAMNSVQFWQGGHYSLLVSNNFGSTTSSEALLTVNTPVCATAPSGLIGWWKGDGNAADSVAANNGTLSNASYTTGMVGQAFSFNGSYGSVNIADQPAYALTNSLTMEGWIRPRGIGWTIFFRGDHRPGLDPYFLSMGGGNQISFYITQANGTGTNINSGAIVYNQWIHVAATLDGSSGLMSLYTNGVLSAQITTSYRPFGALQANQSPGIGIGNVNDGGNNFPFNGEIDEMSLYNRALSQAEIQSIYNAGSAGKWLPVSVLSGVPAIFNLSPNSGTNSAIVTISGTNFSATIASNIVYFGAVRATVLSASITNLTVTVPSGSTFAPVTVTVGRRTASSSQFFEPTFIGNGTDITADSFAPGFSIGAGTNHASGSAVIADFDGDGKPDIAILTAGNVSIYRNISTTGTLLNTASFATRVDYPFPVGTGTNAYKLRAVDLDGDGRLDLMACQLYGTNVTIFHNIATPGSLTTNSFEPAFKLPAGNDCRFAAAADLDGDGRVDILALNTGDHTISIYKNNGTTGTLTANSFAAPVVLTVSGNPYEAVIADLDGDGRPDLAVADSIGNTISLFQNVTAPGVLTSNSFIAQGDLPATGSPETIIALDLDGDGTLDLITGSPQSNTINVYRNHSTRGWLTTCSFDPPANYSAGGSTHALAIADFNGDSKPDVNTFGGNSSYMLIFQNNSIPGALNANSLSLQVAFGQNWWWGNQSLGLASGDLDGDGRPDVVFCDDYANTLTIYQNRQHFGGAPVITSQPSGLTNLVGTTVSFNISSDGTVPLSYQWRFNGAAINGATNAVLTLNNIQFSQAGNYSVLVSNGVGMVSSSNAVLGVYATAPSGLVSWWRGEGDAADVVGLNNGSPLNGVAFASGKVGQAFNFNGGSFGETHSVVQIPYSATLVATNASIEAWISPASQVTNSEHQCLIFGEAYGYLQLVVQPGSTGVKAVLGLMPNRYGFSASASSTNDIPINQFTHLVGTWDGATLKLYVNGALNSQSTSGNQPVPSGCSFFIGGFYSPNNDSCQTESQYFNGLIDEVSFYNRSLMPAEIQALYNAGNAGKCVQSIPPVIVSQPSNQSVTNLYQDATFYVVAAGTPPLSYQWSLNGVDIPGATSSSLYLGGVVLSSQAGNYAVRVSNAFGTTSSSSAVLNVNPGNCASVPAGLIGWWKGDGSAVDMVTGRNGTVVNSSYVDGIVGKAFAFDIDRDAYQYMYRYSGWDQWNYYYHTVEWYRGVQIPDQPVYALTNSLTMEAWINPRALGIVLNRQIFWHGDNSVGSSYGLYVLTNQLDFYVRQADGSEADLLSPRINLGQWLHVAASLDGSTGLMSIYTNGVLASQITTTIRPSGASISYGSRGLCIGNVNDGGNSPFTGQIEEVALYNRALSQNEIQSVFNAGRAGKCAGSIPPVVLAQPNSRNNYIGTTATFLVTAGGTGPLNYQWSFNGTPIVNATNAVLTLTNVQLTQAGNYTVLVTNAYGSVTSDNVLLVVNTTVPSGIIGWWKGDGNAVDSVAGNNGTLVNASYTAGMVGQAFSFNGQYGSVNIPDQPAYALTNSLTMEGWIRPRGIGWNIFFRGDHRPGLDPYFLSMSGGNQIGFYITQANGTGTNINSGAIVYNQWIHVAATLDGSSGLMSLYTNGVLSAQITTSYRPFGALQSNQSPGIGIGNVNDGGNNFPFNGEIDEMALYNRALSQAEIQSIYNAGNAGKPATITTQPASQQALVGDDVFFRVIAMASPNLAYQWYFNGIAIAGATNSVLEIDNVQSNNNGNYYVTVSSPSGSVTLSQTASLTTISAPGGYVVANGSLTNFVFKGDTTYYVNSTVQLFGTTTIEGGTVIKFFNHAASQLFLHGGLSCQTPQYLPAILTSKDDNSVGAVINTSTGTPSPNKNAAYIADGSNLTNTYRHLHIRYALTGIEAGTFMNVWDCQFVQCGMAVEGSSRIALHNVLIAQTTNCVYSPAGVTAEFLTADQCQSFLPAQYTGGSLTNSILTAFGNMNAYTLVSSVARTNGSGIYQSVGAGNYYLSSSSSCRGAGSTNINPAVLADIQKKTTWPPIFYSNVTCTSNMILGIYAARDTNANPDLGYHYDPIDHFTDSLSISNAQLTITNGAVIACDDNSSTPCLWMQDGSSLVSFGAPNAMNVFTHYAVVQEQPMLFGGSFANETCFNTYNLGIAVPNIVLKFTEFTGAPIGSGSPLYLYSAAQWACNLDVKNCEFWNGFNNFTGGTNTTISLFNNLFYRSGIKGPVTRTTNFLSFCNNTVVGIAARFNSPGTNYWQAFNNIFDTVSFNTNLSAGLNNGYNAYINCTRRVDGLTPSGTDYVSPNAVGYQSGPLGNFYLPPDSPLIDAGSVTADQVGLYHFTTQTSQVKEGNTIVDIGYHYVAVDINGNPVDTNGDGNPDYLQDGNGNGLFDVGDMSNWGPSSYNGLNGTTVLQVFTPLK